ncbi:hypothetical protein PA10_00139 [Pseudomonas phage pPa_SNUABM_DT01]|nr:hypothetical protein PA10_00139 [Pseudomonas phage pPa_SNUABM_DT01]
MAECNIILDGVDIHRRFLDDLSRVFDHQYDIDEVYALYPDWCRRGQIHVDAYARPLYPVFPGSAKEEQEEAEDNFIALRNAMINLYCAIDRATPGLDRRSVVHAGFYPGEEALIITTR